MANEAWHLPVLKDCASVGRPPPQAAAVETLRFTVYDFKKRTEAIESPVLKAHGYEWSIGVSPRMKEKEVESVGFHLRPGDGVLPVSAYVGFRFKGAPLILRSKQYLFIQGTSLYMAGGTVSRPDLLNVLESDGSMVIEVGIRMPPDHSSVWIPQRHLEPNDVLVKLYEDAASSGSTSDVAFAVGGNIYWAHRCVLSLRCRELYEISNNEGSSTGSGGNGDGENTAPIPIDSVRGDVFESLLEYVYTVKTPDIDIEAEAAVELLVAADRFGCIGLKLWVECYLVDQLLNLEIAAAMFLLGDSLSCAWLKEAASDWIALHPDSTREAAREDWSKIEESERLVKELETNTITMAGFRDSDRYSANRPVVEMAVPTLRAELDKEGLEVDGSREALVNRLESFRNRENNIGT